MIIPKTREEIELMRESALIVSKTLGMLAAEVKPGVTTLHLDKLAEEFIRDHGAEPGFLGMYDFPNTLCMSPNAQVVHGIPNDKPLEEGDIISIDCGAKKHGFYGDHAYTFPVGKIDPETEKPVPSHINSLRDLFDPEKASIHHPHTLGSKVIGEIKKWQEENYPQGRR